MEKGKQISAALLLIVSSGLLGLSSLNARAEHSGLSGLSTDDIRLGEPAYGGNGCPAGTASASLSMDGKSLSILFDQYLVEAGGSTRKRLDRKSCNISIPVHVPQGMSVSIVQVDYRGFNSLPYGARSQFNVEYFLAGSRGPRYSRLFTGALEREYLVSNPLELDAMVWSACGADVNLRTNSSMTVYANSRGEQSLATVDSADINAGLIYHLQWRSCNSGRSQSFGQYNGLSSEL